jgi:hypothetical protein
VGGHQVQGDRRVAIGADRVNGQRDRVHHAERAPRDNLFLLTHGEASMPGMCIDVSACGPNPPHSARIVSHSESVR